MSGPSGNKETWNLCREYYELSAVLKYCCVSTVSWGDITHTYEPPLQPCKKRECTQTKVTIEWKPNLGNQWVFIGVISKYEWEMTDTVRITQKQVHPWKSHPTRVTTPKRCISGTVQPAGSASGLGLYSRLLRQLQIGDGGALGILQGSAFSDTPSLFTSMPGELFLSLLEGLFQFRGICSPCAHCT